jgi:hypothetical protein
MFGVGPGVNVGCSFGFDFQALAQFLAKQAIVGIFFKAYLPNVYKEEIRGIV